MLLIRNLLLTLSVIFLSGISFLSNAQILSTGAIQKRNSLYEPQIIGADEDNVYVYSSGSKLAVEAYDRDNYTKKFAHIVSGQKLDGEKAYLKEATLLNGDFLIIYETEGTRKKEAAIYAHKVNGSTGEPLGAPRKILEGGTDKRKESNRFLLELSPDRSKIFLQSTYKNYKTEEYTQKSILLDENLALLFEDETNSAEIPASSSIFIDNEGSIYNFYVENNQLIGASFDAIKDFERWETTIDFDIPSLDEWKITGLRIRLTENNDVLVLGKVVVYDYSKENAVKNRAYLSKGIAFARVDGLTKETDLQTVNLYDNMEDMDTKIKSIHRVLHQDGVGTFYFSHSTNIITATYVDGRLDGNTISLGDPIVAFINEEGELKWIKTIEMNQFLVWNRTILGYKSSAIGKKWEMLPSPGSTCRYMSLRHMGYGVVLNEDYLSIYTLEGVHPMKKNRQDYTMYDLDYANLVQHNMSYEDGSVTTNEVSGKTLAT